MTTPDRHSARTWVGGGVDGAEHGHLPLPEARRWAVAKFVGEDPHKITPDEAIALRDDLVAASVAAHEHSMLRETR